MNNQQIKWTSKQIKNLVEYLVENAPLDDNGWQKAVDTAGEITKSSRNNQQVAEAVTGILGVFDKMYQGAANG